MPLVSRSPSSLVTRPSLMPIRCALTVRSFVERNRLVDHVIPGGCLRPSCTADQRCDFRTRSGVGTAYPAHSLRLPDADEGRATGCAARAMKAAMSRSKPGHVIAKAPGAALAGRSYRATCGQLAPTLARDSARAEQAGSAASGPPNRSASVDSRALLVTVVGAPAGPGVRPAPIKT